MAPVRPSPSAEAPFSSPQHLASFWPAAGYYGGKVDAVIMRVADVILSFPTILLALLVSGIARAVFPAAAGAEWAPIILICAIAIHEWVQYARTVRAATMVETGQGLRARRRK